MSKEKWFVVEEIPQNTPFMMSGAMRFVIQEWPKRGLGDEVERYLTLFEEDFGKMCYPRIEFDAEADFLSQKMLDDPDWALGMIKKIKDWSDKFFEASKKLMTLDFSEMKSQVMIAEYKKPLEYHVLSHGLGASVSWHADHDKERVSRRIRKEIDKQIQNQGTDMNVAQVFSLLSTPIRESFVKQEEKELLKLAVKQDETGLKKHAKKYEWLNYQYKGPAYDFSYFKDRFDALIGGRDKPAKLLEEIKRKEDKVKREQKRLLQELNFDNYQTQLIKLSQAMVFIKNYRKDALYHGMYAYEPFFREVGRRLGLSLDQVRAMNYWEIEPALLEEKYDVDELNARLKFCVAWVDQENYIMYTGQEAKDLLEEVTFEEVEKKDSDELTGSCAFPGMVKGTVRIVNVPEDMQKMNEGDILVAYNTNPNLVPAMKKAAAIISEAGGLTCHAAIVSRELEVPCVVGASGANRTLKDGDMVEVDAESGIVKKIKT